MSVVILLFDFAIGWAVEELEGHKFDHTLGGEELCLVWVLHLLFEEREDCAVRQIVERVVVELAHWHSVRVLLTRIVDLPSILNKILHVPEHMTWLTALHDRFVGL